MSPTLTAGIRVKHANQHRSYGVGVIVEVVLSALRPASKAYVSFDGEPTRRLIWLDDLEPLHQGASQRVAKAGVSRMVWPPERAGELAPVLA